MPESSDEEDYVQYGNALDPLDINDLPRRKPITIEDQIVTDEKGKRRFHGAFTGGFSAGYWNSVGSKDGWTPSEFKSSRGSKSKLQQQKPQDFMDDEDLGEFGFSPQVIQTTSKFEDKTKFLKRKRDLREDAIIPGDPILDQYLTAPKETIGMKLLQAMGWRSGQGIGSKAERALKVYGCQLPESNATMERDFSLAPEDVLQAPVKPKYDAYGLGYKPLNCKGLLQRTSNERFNLFIEPGDEDGNAKKKFKIGGQAFGVGIYEEEDADVYDRNDLSQYDFALELSPNHLSSETKKKKKTKTSRWSSEKDALTESIVPALEGFYLSKVHFKVALFPPPSIPKSFVPYHQLKKSRFEQIESKTTVWVSQSSNLTPQERSTLLNSNTKTTRLPEFVSPKNDSMDVIQKGKTEKCLPLTEGSGQTDFRIPFSGDPVKQKRYEDYLACIRNGRRDALTLLQPSSMTEWEKQREKIEFERLSAMVGHSTRFVSAGFEGENETRDKILDSLSKEVEKTPKKLSFSILKWYPAKLLCQRFNVRNPYPESRTTGVPGSEVKQKKFQLFDNQEKEPIIETHSLTRVLDVKLEEPPKASSLELNESLKTFEKLESDIEPINDKPSIDLFKAIFVDSSDSEDENKKESLLNEPNIEIQKVEKKPESEIKFHTKEESKSNMQTKGIFSGIDFDALNKPTSKKLETKAVKEESPIVPARNEVANRIIKNVLNINNDSRDQSEIQHEYGPALPGPSQGVLSKEVNKSFFQDDTDSSDSSDKWVDSKELKNRKKKLKKSKSKHKKHKKKSKKNSKHRR